MASNGPIFERPVAEESSSISTPLMFSNHTSSNVNRPISCLNDSCTALVLGQNRSSLYCWRRDGKRKDITHRNFLNATNSGYLSVTLLRDGSRQRLIIPEAVCSSSLSLSSTILRSAIF